MKSFRCNRSGNIVSFINENDIAGLRKHEGYTEVLNETIETCKSNDGDSHENGENANEKDGKENAIQDAGNEEKRQVLKRGRPKKSK